MLRDFKYTSIQINETWIMMSHQFYLEKHVSHYGNANMCMAFHTLVFKTWMDFSYDNIYLNVINMIMTMFLIA